MVTAPGMGVRIFPAGATPRNALVGIKPELARLQPGMLAGEDEHERGVPSGERAGDGRQLEGLRAWCR